MKAILLALWLLLCLKLSAQNINATGIITGSVSSKETGLPVDGATAILKKDRDTMFSKLSFTNKSGVFKFDQLTDGTYYILIKHLRYSDYKSASFVINEKNRQLVIPGIILQMQSHNLKEVVIKAGPKAFTEQKLDGTIVNVAALISNTGVSAMEVLNNSPGVEVTDDAISLRGKQGVTVYIDGRQSYLAGKDLVDYLRSLPSATLDKIELMPNPPAKYHVNGNSGIINIITKKNNSQGFSGNLAVSHGQGEYAKSNYSLNLNYKTGKLNFFADGAYSSTNNYFKVNRVRNLQFADVTDNYSISQDNFETSNRKNIHYRFGFDEDINENNSIGLVIDGFSGPYKENGNYLLQFAQQKPDSLIKTQSDLVRQTTDVSGNFNYQHKFNKTGQLLNISADYLNYYDNAVQNLNSNTYLPNNAAVADSYTMLTKNPFNANVYSLKADYETKLMDGIKFSTGLQSIYSIRNSSGNYFTGTNLPDDSLDSKLRYSENINAAYISFNKELKFFAIQAGLRYEQTHTKMQQFNYAGAITGLQNLNYNDLFPTVYVSYKLDTIATNNLIFSFSTRIDRPDYSSLNPFSFYFDKYTLIRGNAALQPQHTANFDLSFNHLSNFTVGAIFTKGSNSIIQYYEVSQQSLINNTININSYTYLGLYSNTAIPLLKWWKANLYGSLYEQDYSGNTPDGTYLNNKVFTALLSGNSQFKFNKDWSAELSGYYRTKTTFGQGIYLPVWRLNTSVQKKVFNGKGAFTLSGMDLLHSWKIRRDIMVDNAEIISSNSNDTRQVNLAFTYRFGASGKTYTPKTGLQTERSRAGVN